MTALLGLTWDHPRGYDPMLAAADAFSVAHGVKIEWERQSLFDFGDRSIDELSGKYDLLVIDHPLVPAAADASLLKPLDATGHDAELAELAGHSVGPSHRSYQYRDHQWALAIDAAAQVCAWRPDLLKAPPSTRDDIIKLGDDGLLLFAMDPQQSSASFCSLAANRGAPPATTADCFVPEADGIAVLDLMQALVDRVPRECFAMDSPAVLEVLAKSSTFACSPLLFGYTNYARAGVRAHRVRFSDIADFWGTGRAGSELGGAGIAVSATSLACELAIDYAFFVAGPACQHTIYFDAGGQPAHSRAWEDERLNDLTGDFFTGTRQTLEGAWVRPADPRYPPFHEHAGRLIHQALKERAGPRTTINELNDLYAETFGRR